MSEQTEGAERLTALHVTKAGAPGHPLYLPASATPRPWPPAYVTPPAECSHGEPEGECASCAACAACRGECGVCPYVTPPAR